MLGVCKQDNVTVHGGQMRPRSCRRTLYNLSKQRATSSQLLGTVTAGDSFTSDNAAHHAESGDDLTCGTRRRERSNNDNIICCSEKGRLWTRPSFKLKSTRLRRIALRRAPCWNLMWAYQPWSTRQSASLCVKEPPHTNLRRPSVRWSLPSQSSCRRVRQ